MRTSLGFAGLALIFAVGMAPSAARADDQPWHSIATLTVEHHKGKKDVKQVPVGHQFDKLRIVCTEGEVIINTVVVRANGDKQIHEYGKKLAKKERIDIDVGHEVNVDSLVYTVHAHPTFAEAIKEASEDALGHAIHL